MKAYNINQEMIVLANNLYEAIDHVKSEGGFLNEDFESVNELCPCDNKIKIYEGDENESPIMDKFKTLGEILETAKEPEIVSVEI